MRFGKLALLVSCALSGNALASGPQLKKIPLPTTEAACVARGGEWIFAGPQKVTKYCFLQTKDGGKACKTSRDCQSECIEVSKGSTQCASTFSGCFEPTGRGTVTQCVN
jgi:hypothetical protein